VAAPLAQPLAEDEIGIGHPQQILEQHQMFSTPSGIGKNVGCRYTLLAGEANNSSFSAGSDAVISDDFTTQMLVPSLRRV
jgi:hypothetical protein